MIGVDPLRTLVMFCYHLLICHSEPDISDSPTLYQNRNEINNWLFDMVGQITASNIPSEIQVDLIKQKSQEKSYYPVWVLRYCAFIYLKVADARAQN